jgi:ribulose-5-phosphate 4-epimerase/fuculose-1-phosphate aldolase
VEQVVRKYLGKIETQGLARCEDVLFLARDAEIYANRPALGLEQELYRVLDGMNCSSLLYARVAEPYRSILDEIALRDARVLAEGRIFPRDAETRTFLHDIPVLDTFSADAILSALSQRKTAIIRNHGIVTFGAVTPEQAFIFFSSVCFTTFVKYFSDTLRRFQQGSMSEAAKGTFERIWQMTETVCSNRHVMPLGNAPSADEDDILAMIAEAGRAVVETHLVDSCFGNISYIANNAIYISQTGSSLDELEGCIDVVPLAGTSSVGITASSELSAHKSIYAETGLNAILHGHPRFSVIMSMDCERVDCESERCYKSCPENRAIRGIPIVSGEIGTGPTGLLHTVPQALHTAPGVIVYGHGVFTAGRHDFREAFATLQTIERTCMDAYREAVGFRSQNPEFSK